MRTKYQILPISRPRRGSPKVANTTNVKSRKILDWKFDICHLSFDIPCDSRTGSTLIELIIYMVLLSLFLLVLTNIFVAILRMRTESQASSSVDQDGRYILARLAYDINRSTATNIPGSSTLALTIGGQTYTYAVNNSKLQLTSPSGTDLLNSSGSTIGSVNFQKISNAISSGPPATPAFVQVNFADPQTTQAVLTVNYAQAQVAGDTNILAVGWNDAVANISSVIDSAGNSYQLAAPLTRGDQLSQAIYYARNIVAKPAGANTITVTFNQPAAFIDLRATEYSGLDTTNPVDVTASAVGAGGATASSGAATTTAVNDLIFGAGMTFGTYSGAGAGFTNRVITEPDKDNVEDLIAATVGSYTVTEPVNNKAWVLQMVAFKAATASTSILGLEETIKTQFTVNSVTLRGTQPETRSFVTTIGRRVR